MIENLAYAPDLSRLFETFDIRREELATLLTDDGIEDDYVKALWQLGVHGAGLYGVQWSFMRGSGLRRTNAFRRELMKWDVVSDIQKSVGENGKSPDGIVDELKGKYESGGVRTVLAWMEQLDMLTLTSGSYRIATLGEEEEEEEEPRPVLDETIDVREDKMSVFEYLRRLERGLVVLNPDFQRNVVWKEEQKSKFIESVLMDLPLPPIYLKKDADDVHYIIVDGLQRTSTLKAYLHGDFALCGLEPLDNNRLNGCYVSDLDGVKLGLRTKLEDKQLFLYTIQASVKMNMVYDIFNRINTGGTQLSRQEIRNCILLGRSTTLLKEMSEDEIFKQSIGWGISDLRMKDREAVLRCLAFIVQDYELAYDGSMDEFLEKAMKIINKMGEDEVLELKARALKVFAATAKVFGDTNFRIPTDYTRGRINIAVMESVFHCFYKADSFVGKSRVEDLRKAFGQMLQNSEYINAVRWSTGSISTVLTRFRKAHFFLDQYLN